MKQIITDQSILEAQSSGWMADFGEYLPFDAVLYNGEDPASYHNRYPEEWGKLTQEALQENGMENEIMYFMRSAWIKSPQYNSMFWLGDQLVSWDEYDGLKNVVLGALSSALCGKH
jgi:alpha-glucosidase